MVETIAHVVSYDTIVSRRGLARCAVVLTLAIALPASSRAASDRGQPEAAPHWAGQALQDAMRGMPNGTAPTEPAPAVIPELEKFHNPEGFAANYQPAGATPTRGQPFFVPLGTNGRTCQTCHQPS